MRQACSRKKLEINLKIRNTAFRLGLMVEYFDNTIYSHLPGSGASEPRRWIIGIGQGRSGFCGLHWVLTALPYLPLPSGVYKKAWSIPHL